MNKFVKQAVDYTEAYQQYADAPAALREAMCLKTQYPGILEPLRTRDVFAGCRSGGEIVYTGTIRWFSYPGYTPDHKVAGKQGGYCFDFASGGQHATLTVVNQDDLKAAMKEPAKYAHIIVRLGGWSARFIDLERDVQDEILRRTFYA